MTEMLKQDKKNKMSRCMKKEKKKMTMHLRRLMMMIQDKGMVMENNMTMIQDKKKKVITYGL